MIICFDYDHRNSCFSFDGEINHIGDSNYDHHEGGLTRYNNNLITVGGIRTSPETEIMKRMKNGTFIWSVVESAYFRQLDRMMWHSLVTIPSSQTHEEYVLLIGGNVRFRNQTYGENSKTVLKFNGTWTIFGKLNQSRIHHNTIYWNGAVYVIGGLHEFYFSERVKMEIWKIADSPDEFKTFENWPELYKWCYPHSFIVPDSFFPD